MPIPTPSDKETKKDFLSRCMSNETMVGEYPDSSQRYAICISSWENNSNKINPEKLPDNIKLVWYNAFNYIFSKSQHINDAQVLTRKMLVDAGYYYDNNEWKHQDRVKRNVKYVFNFSNSKPILSSNYITYDNVILTRTGVHNGVMKSNDEIMSMDMPDYMPIWLDHIEYDDEYDFIEKLLTRNLEGFCSNIRIEDDIPRNEKICVCDFNVFNKSGESNIINNDILSKKNIQLSIEYFASTFVDFFNEHEYNGEPYFGIDKGIELKSVAYMYTQEPACPLGDCGSMITNCECKLEDNSLDNGPALDNQIKTVCSDTNISSLNETAKTNSVSATNELGIEVSEDGNNTNGVSVLTNENTTKPESELEPQPEPTPETESTVDEVQASPEQEVTDNESDKVESEQAEEVVEETVETPEPEVSENSKTDSSKELEEMKTELERLKAIEQEYNKMQKIATEKKEQLIKELETNFKDVELPNLRNMTLCDVKAFYNFANNVKNEQSIKTAYESLNRADHTDDTFDFNQYQAQKQKEMNDRIRKNKKLEKGD